MQAMILRLTGRLPRGLRAHVTAERVATLVQFVKFGSVGLIGLIMDTTTVYALRGTLGLYGAGIVAYCVAASVNWLVNRVWTFRGQGSGPAHHQWGRFMIANLAGFTLNRGVYALMVTFVAAAASQPVIATSAGAVAGIFVNFYLSRRVVYR
jgi:putative flippase GtrA